MATNFVKDGHVLDLTAPYNVVSGGGFIVGQVFAVALATASSGGAVQGKVDGVFDLPKPVGDVVSQGAYVYWDNSAKDATVVSSGNTKIGVAEQAVSSGGLVVRTRLNGAF